MATQRETQKLTRLETKIDNITEQLVAIVRMEEQVKTIFHRIEKKDEKQDHIEKRVKDVEDTSRGANIMVTSIERLVWVVITALASYIVWQLNH